MNEFPDSGALADALAGYVADAIVTRLKKSSNCAIALSGGKTPVKFFNALSEKSLNWQAVTITLVDDRWVPETSPRSNARLVKQNLLRGPAAHATFVSLVNSATSPEAGRLAVEAQIARLKLPFAAVVLGMGLDGHTASIFPDGDRLNEALSPSTGQLVETMRAPSADDARITLTMPIILAADHVAIHIEGHEKHRVLEIIYGFGTAAENPIYAVLNRDPEPDIFWSP